MQTIDLANKFITFFSEDASRGSYTEASSSSNQNTGTSFRNRSKKIKRLVSNSKYLSIFLIGIVVLGLLFYAFNNIFSGSGGSVASITGEDGRINVKKAEASQTHNREFLFPLKDRTGKEVSKLKIILRNTELRNEIIVKGQRGTAVQGRTFLILNLKIVNDFDKSLQVNARDYVRLIVNNSNERLAPEIHNDPVEVQAISTKYTRLGFPINDNDKNLTLQIGEINGTKQTINLNMK